jgi:poly-gamma-glutamate synthesis protein (capsule biosynthesis protein)
MRYSHQVRGGKPKKLFILVGITFLVILILSVFIFVVSDKSASKKPSANIIQNNQPPKLVNKLETSMLFVGDVFWGRAIERSALASPLKYAQPFSGLDQKQRLAYDAWIGDMECPITSKDIPYRTQVDSLIFNCRPEFLSEAKKWFSAFTLANNHMGDNGGQWGQTETRNNLEQNGIQYFGSFDNKPEDICEIVAIPARVSTNNQSTASTIPIALCGFHYVGGILPTQEQFDQMKAYAKVMPVVAMPHMGVEYQATAEEAKQNVFRQLIDNGADVVLGDHPHVVQNSEAYKGRLIQYSPGNFMFDQQILGRDTTLSLGVGIKLTLDNQNAIDTYLSESKNCASYKDSCLAKISAKITKRPLFKVAYLAECFENSSGIPKSTAPATCDDIKTKATWSPVVSTLSKKW